MHRKIVAVGDCNTLGVLTLVRYSYPELLGKVIGAEVTNLGHTMATTREGLRLLPNSLQNADCVLIQFGLVDSYKTFKYSPYVLYYPDNILRKQLRALTKKYKKTCRNLGLNKRFGEINVVDIEEYEFNIRKMIEISLPRTIILLETIPSHQVERNPDIIRYNRCLARICKDYKECLKIDLYDAFLANLERYYLDETHSNEVGYSYIAETIRHTLDKLSRTNSHFS